MNKKKKRQAKTEFVLVRMEPELKTKLIEEARRRALDPSSLARMFVAEGLEHEWHHREIRKHRIAKLRRGIEAAERIVKKTKKKGGRNA